MGNTKFVRLASLLTYMSKQVTFQVYLVQGKNFQSNLNVLIHLHSHNSHKLSLIIED